MIPVVGAVINGSLDYVETKVIADRAYKMFFEGDYSAGDTEQNDVDFDEETETVIMSDADASLAPNR
jgi:hypothetical protein